MKIHLLQLGTSHLSALGCREGWGLGHHSSYSTAFLITVLSIGPKFLHEEMFRELQILSKNVFSSKNRNLPFLFFLVLSYWGTRDQSAFKYFLLPCFPGNSSFDSVFQCHNCPLSLLQSINSFKSLSSHSFSTSSCHMCCISLQSGFISTTPLNLIFLVSITSVLHFVYSSVHFSLVTYHFI